MSDLIKALDDLQKEKNIEKEVIMQAIEDSLVAACNRDFGKNAIVNVHMDRITGEIEVTVEKTVVETVEDSSCQISLEEARMHNLSYELGDVVHIEVTPRNFGRIAAQHARSVIVQKIKEEERRVLFQHFSLKEKDIVTGVVQRFSGNNICISLDDKTDAILTEKEQVRGETYHPTDRIKLYIIEVKDTNKGPKILVSRTHPELVRRLFEKEVSEVYDGTVEIKSIAREAGSRTKIAVSSNDPNVDPVGACVGKNGVRVDAVVNDLKGEKIDIITWDEDPARLIENALSPSSVISVNVNYDEKSARVVVPDYQLSLAIGKEGQNARLAAKLTGYKIDIKSESQAAELAELEGYDRYDEDEPYDEDHYDDDRYDDDRYDDRYDDDRYDDDRYEDDRYDDDRYDDEDRYDDRYDDEDRYDDRYDDDDRYEDDDRYDDDRYDEEYNEEEYDEEYEDRYEEEYRDDEEEYYEEDSVEEYSGE